MNKIVEELAPDVNLIISDADMNSYEERLRRRYPDELREKSKVQSGESFLEYFKRLESIYPLPEQKIYLEGLEKSGLASVYGGIAMQDLSKGKELDPRLESVYPKKLNSHIFDKGLRDKSLWYLNMSPEHALDIMRSANLATHALRTLERKLIDDMKGTSRRVMLEGTQLKGIDIPSQLKVALSQIQVKAVGMMVGKELLESMVDIELDKLVTPISLGLLTGESAKSFENISRMLSGTINPVGLLAETTISAVLALDNANIYPSVGFEILNAYAYELKPLSR